MARTAFLKPYTGSGIATQWLSMRAKKYSAAGVYARRSAGAALWCGAAPKAGPQRLPVGNSRCTLGGVLESILR